MNSEISDLLNVESESVGDSDLPIISVWRLATHYVMFFMTKIVKYKAHYDSDVRKSYMCMGLECPACAVGLKPTEHIYLPVWDVQNRRIVVLRVDSRNDGPARKIALFVTTYLDKLHDVVAVIECRGDSKGSFTITAHDPLPQTDRGVLACKDFCDSLIAGAINLQDCLLRLSAEEVGKLATVKNLSVRLVGSPVGPSTSTSPDSATAGPVKESQEA